MLGPKAIKRVRESLGLSQEDLAQRLGVTRVTVARWETGERSPAKEHEGPLYELRQEDNWPSKEFFDKALEPLKNWCGSVTIQKIREDTKVSKNAILRLSETLIESTGKHPDRYQEISDHGDRADELLRAVYDAGLLLEHKLKPYVEEFLRQRKPQPL